jgi:hypothetical protein
MALADPKKAKGIHILSDGTVLDSINGHLVYLDSAPLRHALLSVAEKKARRLKEEKNRENN